ncbi:FABP family protein [Cellulomonas chengniuliangii]|uniref:FABP family protein n=1 Tax=Cellulomonas chengniuliangii TaxID=2968084 RepID=UPI001D0DDD9B|nr:FABP family protein [Cellulomonas chengniuliangii]MCC2316700.1 FABP family protein [Cellulomonas chengniuliangii]
MPFILPEGLAPEVYPLAWLVGEWHGEGVVGYPGIEESAFTQDVTFSHDGGPYLAYTSTIRLVVAPDDAAALAAQDGDASAVAGPDDAPAATPVPAQEPGPVWSTESGFWRVPPERPADLADDQHPVEVLLADPSGFVTLYLGAVGNGRIDLATDVVARTATGADVTAGTRLYGLVNGELMWAHDLAAFGQPMQTYASARLARVGDEA